MKGAFKVKWDQGQGRWFVHLLDYCGNAVWRNLNPKRVVPSDVTFSIYQDAICHFDTYEWDFEYEGSGECVLYFETYYAAQTFAVALVRALRSKYGPDAVRSVDAMSLIDELREHANEHPWEVLSGRAKASTEVVAYLVSCDPCFDGDSKVSDFIP